MVCVNPELLFHMVSEILGGCVDEGEGEEGGVEVRPTAPNSTMTTKTTKMKMRWISLPMVKQWPLNMMSSLKVSMFALYLFV